MRSDRRPPAMTCRRVADLEQLVEFLGDDQHGRARVAQVDQRLADLRGRADVDAPGRLRDHQHRRAASPSRGRRCTSAGCRRTGSRPRPTGPAALTLKRSMIARGPRRRAPCRGSGRSGTGPAPTCVSSRFMSRPRPGPRRVPVAPRERRPGRQRAARPTAAVAHRPAEQLDRRRAARADPRRTMAASSSFWPLPEMPAMPIISPRRTSSETSCKALPVGSSGGSDRPRRPAAPPRRAGAATRASRGGSAPIIIRDRLATVSRAGSQTPGHPARTHAPSPCCTSARTSCSLWLM